MPGWIIRFDGLGLWSGNVNSNKNEYLILWLVFILTLFAWPVSGSGEAFKNSDTPDGLERELEYLLSTGMAETQDPAELLRLASLYLDLGYGAYVDREKKLACFQEGARLAKKSLEQKESSVDAHFLYAANLGQAVKLQGVVAAALNLQTLKTHVNRVLELDGEHAPAHHMLGLMYEELPWFLGGDSEEAGEHLQKAISLDDHYAPARLDLGKWYLKHGDSHEALKQFIRVLETPPSEKRWIWERIHRPQAQILLRQIAGSESLALPGEEKAR